MLRVLSYIQAIPRRIQSQIPSWWRTKRTIRRRDSFLQMVWSSPDRERYILIDNRATGEAVTNIEAGEYREKLHVFRKWFSENVLSATADLLSDAIMIMPYGSAKPKYRDTPNEYVILSDSDFYHLHTYRPPSGSHSLGEKFISPVLQLPQLVLPSKISASTLALNLPG